MWVFTKNSFISAVEHRDRPNDVMIRARCRRHLVRLFPKRKEQIVKTPHADYMWRLVVSKKELAKVLSDYILRSLTYDNFKGAQEPEASGAWMDFLHSVWGAGYSMQMNNH